MKTYVGLSAKKGMVLLDSIGAGVYAGCYQIDTLENMCNVNDERMALYYLYVQAAQTKKFWRGLRWVKRVNDEYTLTNKPILGAKSLPYFATGFVPGSIESLMLYEAMNRREREVYKEIIARIEDEEEETEAIEALKSAEVR